MPRNKSKIKPASKTSAKEVQKPKINLSRIVIPIAIVVLVAGLLFLAKSLLLTALVNGRIIWRPDYLKAVEGQSGKKVLNSMITQILVEEEAKKKNIKVSNDEVNQEYQKIEDGVKQRGQDLNQLLAMQGISKQDLLNQIKTQKLAEKILEKDITVSDQEINDYFETNKASFPEGTKLEDIKNNIKEQIYQQKFSDKVQSWLGDLQAKAKIIYL